MHLESTRPKNIDEYKKWLRTQHKVDNSLLEKHRQRYETMSDKLKDRFTQSEFWLEIDSNLKNMNDEYVSITAYQLLLTYNITIYKKSWDSFLLKTFRKNILENSAWPEAPSGGWYLPSNWLSRIKDICRTLLVVKYLDGTEFLATKIIDTGKSQGIKIKSSFEARDHGYYAAHLDVPFEVLIPNFNWESEIIETHVEIQITTQLQDVIRKLTHHIYEERREAPKASDDSTKNWQWNYRSKEFVPNYLGHILHYVEGMIMDIREKQKGGSSE